MRRFIITEDNGSSREVLAAFHPCDDPPPYEASPAQVEYTEDGPREIVAALIIDPSPIYAGPRENVVEVKDNAAGARLMQQFHGHDVLRKELPELFTPSPTGRPSPSTGRAH